jgi:hypothetical protein
LELDRKDILADEFTSPLMISGDVLGRLMMLKKATLATDAEQLEQIPNIGKQIATDLRLIGILKPSDLKTNDPYELYSKVCFKTKTYKDPCLLDVLIAAASFMNGNGAQSWWVFSDERKKNFHRVKNKVERFKTRS